MSIATVDITAGIFRSDYKTNFGLWKTVGLPLLNFAGIDPLAIITPTRRLTISTPNSITCEQASGIIALALFNS